MNYKKVLFAALSVVVLVGGFMITSPNVVKAADTHGYLVKSPQFSAVYYVYNGKRYVFPDLGTYKSWYPDFTSVQVITADQLAAYPIGGNVTYRPTSLIKIQSDPRVYAVSKGGVLHWVKDEALAVAIFGGNWNKSVRDVVDSFFVNYQQGSDLHTNTDYNYNLENGIMEVWQNY